MNVAQYAALGSMTVGTFAVNNPIPEVESAERLLLAIASGSYAGLILTGDETFRYLDWTLTTPLLTYTYWKTAVELGWTGTYELLGISPILMSIFGYLAERIPKYRNLYYGISFVFFLTIVLNVIEISSYLYRYNNALLNFIPWFFYIGWTLYALTFYTKDPSRSIVWSVLDIINKPLYALVLGTANDQLVASGDL